MRCPVFGGTARLISRVVVPICNPTSSGGVFLFLHIKFLNRTPIAYVLRSRTDKWDLIKLQSFCKAKDTIKRTHQQPTNWEKIFTNPTSDRGLISNIYKELKKLDPQKTK